MMRYINSRTCKNPLWRLLLLCFMMLFTGLAGSDLKGQKKKAEEEKPNIILVVADDMGWGDLGIHNEGVHTPHLNAFFKESVELESFYTAPSCTPTRMGLLTGKYPDRMGFGFNTGVIHANTRGGIPSEETTLPEVLGENGYEKRACIGKWHLGHSNVQYHPLNNGFTEFYGSYGGQVDYFDRTKRNQLDWHSDFDASYDVGYTTDLIGNAACGFLREVGKEKSEDPFFMYVAFTAPHEPLMAKREDLIQAGFEDQEPLYALPNDSLRSERGRTRGRGNNKRQTYKAMLTSMDESIGNLLITLQQEGLAENTIVLFMSDNGGAEKKGGYNKPLRAGKGSFYEGGIHVPAAIRWPAGGFTSGKSTGLVSFVDVLPTLCDLVGVKLKKLEGKLDGFSARRIIENDGKGFEDRIFYIGLNSLIQGHWKLAYGELYNLAEDPNERVKLNEKNPEKLKELQRLEAILSKQIHQKVNRPHDFTVEHEWKMPTN